MKTKGQDAARDYTYNVRGRAGTFEAVFTSCASQSEADGLARQFCKKYGYTLINEKSQKNGGEHRGK